MALLCSRKENLLSGKMGSQILSTVGQCQLYSHPLCVSGGSKAAESGGAMIRTLVLLGEWNTILLTPVNRWLYDCLFLLVEEGKIWPPLLPDFYDPESTFVTECCRSPKLYCPCVHPQWSSNATTIPLLSTAHESLSSNWLVNLEKHFRDWGSTHTEWFQLFSHSPKYSKYKYLCK